jgi:hypothetical protein
VTEVLPRPDTELERLARRCEEASGRDRDLDDAIIDAFGWRNDFCVPIPPGYIGLPAYTASLDAAMSLVPEGMECMPLSFKVEHFYLGNSIWQSRASVWDGLGGVSSLDTASVAATPALALTAASLRARALFLHATSAS